MISRHRIFHLLLRHGHRINEVANYYPCGRQRDLYWINRCCICGRQWREWPGAGLT